MCLEDVYNCGLSVAYMLTFITMVAVMMKLAFHDTTCCCHPHLKRESFQLDIHLMDVVSKTGIPTRGFFRDSYMDNRCGFAEGCNS